MSASEVSAFEPQPLAEPELDLPEFVVVRRGVDRRQVEEWGNKLTSLIEQERRRADQAEKALYRMQLEAKGSPSFSHLGSHVAEIIEEAGRSAEKLLLDAADRAQETIDGAEAEGAEIITAAQAQAGEIKRAARQDAEQVRVEGARVAEETRRAAEAFRAQTEQDARNLLEEARESTEQLWQETERECAAVEARPGAWRGCGGAPMSSSGGYTVTWGRCWRRSVSASMAPRTWTRRPRSGQLRFHHRPNQPVAGGRPGRPKQRRPCPARPKPSQPQGCVLRPRTRGCGWSVTYSNEPWPSGSRRRRHREPLLLRRRSEGRAVPGRCGL